MANPNAPVTQGLSREDLIALVEAIQKPRKSEAELLKEEQQKLDREQMAATLKQAEDFRVMKIKTCQHMRSNGSTPAVYIENLGKLYCQHCSGWIDPKENPELFNKLFQLANGVD